MRGPIDYILVGFDGNKFDGSILGALKDAVGSGVIAVVAISFVTKDTEGVITTLDLAESGDNEMVALIEQYSPDSSLVNQEDIDEISDLIEPNTSAGLLVIEHLWAKPLRDAILSASGFLIAEGRIHPAAANELN
jgi:hypothetical protein